MINGISEQEEAIIKGILSKYPYNFYYYSSRVKGDYTPASDLDILLENGQNAERNIIEQIELEFNKSKIPYVVKITNRADIEDYFYDLIKDSLVKIL